MIPRLNGIKRCFKTAKFFKKLNIDLIHSFHYGADYSEALSAKISGIPWIYTKKNMNWAGNSKNGWKTRTLLASHIVVQNKDMIKMFFPNLEKISLIPRGVDTSEFKQASKSKKMINKLNIKKSEIVILCVANLHPVKGVEILLNAFERLYEKDKNHKLIIVGDNDNTYGKELINISKSLSSTSRIQFVGKVLNVKKYYSIADIFVLPTLNKGRVEGSPVALLEALACGKKVLASNVSGIKDILSKYTDCLFEPGNIDELFKKLYTISFRIKNKIKNDNEVSRFIIENYGIGNEIKKHELVYRKFIKKTVN